MLVRRGTTSITNSANSNSNCLLLQSFTSLCFSSSSSKSKSKSDNKNNKPSSPFSAGAVDPKKRTYTSGYEHDPYYGPEAERKRMLQRGINLPKQGTRRMADVSTEQQQQQQPEKPTQRADTRYFRKIKDFREMEDGDPYKDLFGESTSFVRSKVGAWRNQFEKENEHVELPYERTSVISRTAPNWFVKWMLGIRENQGMDFMYMFIGSAGALFIVWLWSNATVAPMGKERRPEEIK